MRILHVIPSLAEAHGGPSRAMALIEQALAGEGVQVEVATTDDDGHGGRFEAGGQPQAPSGNPRHFFRKSTNVYKSSMALSRWLRTHVRDYDLVHIHALFSYSSTTAARSAKLSGVPYVVRPLGTLGHYGLGQRRRRLKRWSVALVEGPILRSAAAVHFTSELERIEAEQLGIPLRAAVIPLALDAPCAPDDAALLESFPSLRGRPWVAYLSRLDRKKNVEGLLEAAQACAAEFPQLLWAVAGDGDAAYVASLREHARSLGVEDRVVWTGHLSGGRKAALLCGARCFVLPSRSENFGIAAAEALQAGAPVVLGEGVALAQVASERGAGRIVDTSARQIADAVAAYLRDEPARARASACAVALAEEEFSLPAMGRRLVAMYRDVLARSPSRSAQ